MHARSHCIQTAARTRAASRCGRRKPHRGTHDGRTNAGLSGFARHLRAPPPTSARGIDTADQSFCFDDARRGAEDKVVTFALHVGRGKAGKAPITKEHILPLQRTVSELAKTLRSLQSQVGRTNPKEANAGSSKSSCCAWSGESRAPLAGLTSRAPRHVLTQDSIEGRVNWFTLVESVAILAVVR